MLGRYLKYLHYMARHKWFVFIECCRLGVPLRGVIHDISKYRLCELIPYARYFYEPCGRHREIARSECGYYKPTQTGDKLFDFAWLLHQKVNDHHWQWWVLPKDDGGELVLKMADGAVREMVADWRGAGRAQRNGAWTALWYLENQHKMRLHPHTRAWIEHELLLIDDFRYNQILIGIMPPDVHGR